MRLGVRWAWLALALAPVAALGDSAPRVVLATPGIGDGAIERFTMRFSQPMVALGDPRAAAPVDVQCAVSGQGRWVDQQTYVWEFAKGLPGGTTCTFQVKAGIKSVAGYAMEGQAKFTVDAGGPVARAILPGSGDDDDAAENGGGIEEDQVFLVAANLAPTPQSVAANAYCAVDGIGEKIPVEVLDAGLPGKLLAEMGTNRWPVRQFLDNAGLPSDIPASEAERRKMTQAVVALRCQRPLPPGRDMALVWGKGIASAAGKLAGADQRFDYTVRKPFAAKWECSRTNAQSGCNPVQKAFVRFSAPIAMSLAQQIRIVLPDGKAVAPHFDDDDKKKPTIADITFDGPLPFETTAKLTLPANVTDESGRKLSNAERFPLEVRFDRAPPLVKFAGSFGIVEAKEGGVLPVTVRNVEPALQGRNLGVSGQSLRVDGTDRSIAAWLRTVDDADDEKSETVKRGGEDVEVNHTGDTSILGGQGKPLSVALPGKGRDFEVVGIPLAKPGFYVVELASPVLGRSLLGRDAPRYVATAALVTNLAVHFKWGRERSLAWVTALDTGKPVAGARFAITDSCTGALLAHGTSDASGAAFVPAGLPEPATYGSCDESSENHPLMVSARLGDDMSFTLTSWGEGIRPYDFELPFGYSAAGETLHTVFDRALVREGETLHMKHLLRRQVGTGFVIPAGLTGTLKLSHSGSDTEFEVPLRIAANGSGETSWTAPAGAPMGTYNLSVEAPDGRTITTGQSFRLDEYKLPTMRATVTGPKDAQVRPRTMPLDLFVGYLSGGGASNLAVDVRVGWFPHETSIDGYDKYSFTAETIEEGIKPLNGNDSEDASTLPPTQTLPATLKGDGTQRTSVDVPAGLDAATDMQVEMDYQDANGQVLTASKRIAIYPSAVQLGIATDGWLMKQDDLRLRFVALDTAGKPIKGQTISVTVYKRETLTARRRLIGGFYAYDNNQKTTKLDADCTATTDAQGLAQCKVDPGVSGEVYAVATTKDAHGNVARATRSVWLAGDDDWWFGGDNGDRMDVVPEQLSYKAGDTARFQVRMPFREATALVTVEREGVLSSYVTRLSGKDPVVEVKMPGSYAPDVFVSVMAVRGRVTSGFWDWVHRVAMSLGLSSTPDQAPEPTALVDLAKPSYRLGLAKVKVGWEAHQLDVAVRADRERYAARDTAEVDVRVTTPDGRPARAADLTFAAVDQALLQLAPNDSWDVLTAMMGDRDLSVLTSTAQTQVVGKRHYGRKAVEAGGGGGGDLSGLNRENFQPVVLWRGHVDLDPNGHARIAVPLSDALTTFKLVGIATEGAGRFGTGSADIRTAQDLSIYAGLPPLVRTGDWYAAGFTLRNGSDRPMTVTANIEVFPRVAQGRPLTVTIPAGGAAPVAWNLVAPQGQGTLRWQVSARASDGRAADRLTTTQEVVPAVPLETWAATLARVGDAQIPIGPPAGALPGFGSVDVQLADTLAPPMEGVRRFMALYPYDCFEQRLSRIVVLGDARGWTQLASDIPTYQASDGLLRYWPSGSLDGSESLTAYVLSLTAEAGLPIPEASRTKMIEAMKAVLDGRLRHEDYGDVRQHRLVAFAALARQGAASVDMLGQIGLTPQEMPTALLSDYLAALDHLPAANAAALKRQAEDVLRTRLIYEGTRLDLSDRSTVLWWLMSSNDEAAAKAVLGTLGKPGWQDEGPKMMVGLALRQSRGRWDTTTANAWGALAVRKFAGLYPAQAIAGTSYVSLGNQAQSRAWPLATDKRMLSFLLPPARTPLILRQSGGAGPWATVSVRAAVPLTQPLFAGYRLTRQVQVVQRRNPGRLTRGDVLRVVISVDATAERNWVVVNDPVPAGATIVGDLGGQSQLLAGQGSLGGGSEFGAQDAQGKALDVQVGVQPAYVERGNDSWRGFFSWVPRGRFTVAYLLRLNGAGRMQLPPTTVEAMYSPAVRAAVPNQPVVVAQK